MFFTCQRVAGAWLTRTSPLTVAIGAPLSGWKYHGGSLTTTRPAQDIFGKEYHKAWQLADLFEAAIQLDQDLLPNAIDLINGIAHHAVNETEEWKQKRVATEWLKLAIEAGSIPLLHAVGSALPQDVFGDSDDSGVLTFCEASWKVRFKYV